MNGFLDFASRFHTVPKGRLFTAIAAVALSLSLAALPCPALAEEGAPASSASQVIDGKTQQTNVEGPATGNEAQGADDETQQAGVEAQGGNAAAHKGDSEAQEGDSEEGTLTVTVYHFELVYYDDPTFVQPEAPELAGARLIGTSTVEGLKPGDVVRAWEQVGTHPGFAFFDGWPRELTVSEDPSKNVMQLNYFRQASEVTVNYYEASLLDANAAMPLYGHTTVEPIGDQMVEFTKMGSEVLERELYAEVLTGDELAEETDMVEGLAYAGSYPNDMFVSMDSSKNEINLVYTRPVVRPDDVEAGDSLPDLPDISIPAEPDATPDGPDEPDAPGESEGPSTDGVGGDAGTSGDSSSEGATDGPEDSAGDGATTDATDPDASSDDENEQGTHIVDETSDEGSGRADAKVASEDGVLALPQTGDENDIAFSIALLLGALAAVGAAVALRNMRRQ